MKRAGIIIGIIIAAWLVLYFGSGAGSDLFPVSWPAASSVTGVRFAGCQIGPVSQTQDGGAPGAPYTVTLDNAGTRPVNVGQIVTVFYGDQTGIPYQDGSDQETVAGTIAAGQSLSWTFTVPPDLDVISPSDSVSAVMTTACKIVEWSR